MVEGRAKQVCRTWLGDPDTSWHDCVEVVAVDGFTGFKTGTSEELPDAVAVMDPSHVVCLAGDALDGKAMMQAVIDSVASGVPATLTEIHKVGRTLKQRATDILAFFDRPGTLNGPTEVINGRLEHLRGSALGFRNLTNDIARSLLEAGGSRPRRHLDGDEPLNVPSVALPHQVSGLSGER
jgi:transposase